jgi:hypothetical protein
MPFGLLDLSIVTDRLLQYMTDSAATTNLWAEEPDAPLGTPSDVDPGERFVPAFSGLPPAAARRRTGCQVSLYLFHVVPDKFHRNAFPPGERAQRIPQQPLALTLYYLLSAHSDSYIQEQQAMSIALKSLHEHSLVNASVPIDDRVLEYTLTMEPQSVDEIGRLWQSMSTPMRLSAVYRVSVVFLEPPVDLAVKALPVLSKGVHVSAYPQRVISGARVNDVGLVTVRGHDFDAASIVVLIDGIPLHTSTSDPLDDGGMRVLSESTLVLQLPKGTPKGPYPLRLQLDAGEPAALYTLQVPVKVP